MMRKTATTKPQIVNVKDRRVLLRLPNGDSLYVDFAKADSENWLTVYPSLEKTKVEIYGRVPALVTSLGQKIADYTMTPLVESDFR